MTIQKFLDIYGNGTSIDVFRSDEAICFEITDGENTINTYIDMYDAESLRDWLYKLIQDHKKSLKDG